MSAMKILVLEDEPLVAESLLKLVRQLEPGAEIKGPIVNLPNLVMKLIHNKIKKQGLVRIKFDQKKVMIFRFLLRRVFVLQLIKYNLIKKKLKPRNRRRQINSYRHLQ